MISESPPLLKRTFFLNGFRTPTFKHTSLNSCCLTGCCGHLTQATVKMLTPAMLGYGKAVNLPRLSQLTSVWESIF